MEKGKKTIATYTINNLMYLCKYRERQRQRDKTSCQRPLTNQTHWKKNVSRCKETTQRDKQMA